MTDPFGHLHQIITPCPGQDDEKLLAALAQEHVSLSKDLPRGTDHGL